MDEQELKDWCDFCEGRKPYTPFMLSNIFMGMFVELNERDINNLRTMFSYVPNSSRTLEKLLRIGRRNRVDNRSEKHITDLVIRDLTEMRRIIDDPEILASVDMGVSEIVSDETQFRQVFQAPLNVDFIDALADYFIEVRPDDDKKISVLANAFYGIASNLHLQFALTASLLDIEISCDNYFELYLMGVDYALDTNGVLVFTYSVR